MEKYKNKKRKVNDRENQSFLEFDEKMEQARDNTKQQIGCMLCTQMNWVHSLGPCMVPKFKELNWITGEIAQSATFV